LRGQAELGEQFADRCLAQSNAELLFDQVGHDGTRPQPEIEAILTRVLAIDPAKHLLFLTRRQRAWPPGGLAGPQGLQPDARARRGGEPFVNRRAAEAIGRDNRRRGLALSHPRDRHEADGLQRAMIQFAAVNLHAY
jgi:hypothetical protein